MPLRVAWRSNCSTPAESMPRDAGGIDGLVAVAGISRRRSADLQRGGERPLPGQPHPRGVGVIGIEAGAGVCLGHIARPASIQSMRVRRGCRPDHGTAAAWRRP